MTVRRSDTINLETSHLRCDLRRGVAYIGIKIGENDQFWYPDHNGIPIAGKKLDDWIELLTTARDILNGSNT